MLLLPSDNCYALTKGSEGLRLKAYQDTGDVWTIGYGHTGGVKPNSTITQEMANTLLEHDMQYAAKVVNTHALPCTQNQFDVLTDFVFNVGPSQFLTSHLLKYHLDGEYDKAAAEFPKWKYDNGKVIPGLVTRRAAERSLYSHPGPVAIRQQTVAPEHSGSSTVCFELADLGPDGYQFSQALLGQASQAAPESDSIPAGLLSQAWGSIRSWITPGEE